jgi:hypothetical protein
MSRAAFQLCTAGDEAGVDTDTNAHATGDLRVPIALAILELYGADAKDEDVARLVEAMVPIEAAELDPRSRLSHRSHDGAHRRARYHRPTP